MRLTADHRQRSDATKLVYGNGPGDVSPVAHAHMPGNHRVIGEDRIVAHAAIVGNVDIDHQQVVVPDSGRLILLKGPVDGRVFADGISGADHDLSRLVGHVDMLGHAADHGPFEDVVIGAEHRPGLDHDPAFQLAAGLDYCVVFDDAVRADLDIPINSGRGADDGRAVDQRSQRGSEVSLKWLEHRYPS